VDSAVLAILWGLLINSAENKYTLLRYNAIVLCLVSLNMPFDTNFTPATRKDQARISLTINIDKSTSLVYNLELTVNKL